MGGHSNMISIVYHGHNMHNYMKKEASATAMIMDDDVTIEAIQVYEMQNVKILSDNRLHNYIYYKLTNILLRTIRLNDKKQIGFTL